jgi:hypothetical protein
LPDPLAAPEAQLVTLRVHERSKKKPMSNPTWDPTGDVREALRRIVADFGTPALSNPQVMENGLDDQLPNGTEKQKSILVGASKAGVPASLQEHVARGMDPDHAVQLIASRLAEMAGFEATACGWVTSEFARALGYQISDAATQAIAPPAGSPFSAKSDETLLLPYQSTRPPGIPPDYGPPVSERSPPGVPPPASGIGRAMGGAPGGAHRKSVAVIVAVVVICLIGVVVAHQFWPSTPGHPTPLSTTSNPTVPPASSPLVSIHGGLSCDVTPLRLWGARVCR